MAGPPPSDRPRGRCGTGLRAACDRGRWIATEIMPHEPALRQWLARRVSCFALVDDVIQDCYVRLFQAEAVDHVRHPRHYLWQTARSILTQRARRERIAPLEHLDHASQFDHPCEQPLPDARAEAGEELAGVVRALDQLPLITRSVLILRRVEGLSQRATADRLRMSESAIEKHQRRGHRRLVEMLGRE